MLVCLCFWQCPVAVNNLGKFIRLTIEQASQSSPVKEFPGQFAPPSSIQGHLLECILFSGLRSRCLAGDKMRTNAQICTFWLPYSAVTSWLFPES